MTTKLPVTHRPTDLLGLLGFFVAVAAVAVVGSLAVTSSTEQYQQLERPSWAPPGWLFGPVWTVLYIFIAVAGWLVWRQVGLRAIALPMALYAVQLVLNAAWTPLFFGAGWYTVAAIEIVLLWLTIAALIVIFRRHSRLAAWLLVPYLAWVSFATALTIWIAVNN